MYDLPSIKFKFKKKAHQLMAQGILGGVILSFLFCGVVLFLIEFHETGYLHDRLDSAVQSIGYYIAQESPVKKTPLGNSSQTAYQSPISYEQAIIDSVKSASPSVVSIVISKNLPVYEQQFVNPFGDMPGGFGIQIPQYVQKGTKYQEVGAGSGFFVTEDGLILTNKHVVSDKMADYTIITDDGTKYPAKVVALDPVEDLAVIKVQSDLKFPAIKIGDSSGIQIGQGAIAIGNALGQFSNTVSVGVVSGLSRTVSASGSAGFSETLEGIIQTDAAINPGNSGGPLVNLRGEVIGIDTAMAEGAQSIGFAIPINIAKRDINQIVATNKIIYPFLGVRYLSIDDQVKDQYNLSVNYGDLVMKGTDGSPAVTSGSAAEKAGIKEKDVILEFNNQKITKDNSLQKMIAMYNPGDQVTLKVLRDTKEMDVLVTLGERS
jgi:serine protease Do